MAAKSVSSGFATETRNNNDELEKENTNALEKKRRVMSN